MKIYQMLSISILKTNMVILGLRTERKLDTLFIVQSELFQFGRQ